MACSLENEGIVNPSRSRIRVFTFHHEGRFVPYTCTQCSEAWCLQACPVDAIVLNAATGAKQIQDSLCVGCKVCTIACPFGTVNYHTGSGKVIKCDLCGGDPACASACPTAAISYVDSEQTGYNRMQAWAEKNLAGVQATA
jgi:Fe-S-cluster-containing hydrogenase component 2